VHTEPMIPAQSLEPGPTRVYGMMREPSDVDSATG
jgi:hypothetical protein